MAGGISRTASGLERAFDDADPLFHQLVGADRDLWINLAPRRWLELTGDVPRHEMGVSMAHYRNRVRVTQALDRLEQGDESLAALAADLGFADRAHLTRTVRQHLHQPPTALRRLLNPGQVRG